MHKDQDVELGRPDADKSQTPSRVGKNVDTGLHPGVCPGYHTAAPQEAVSPSPCKIEVTRGLWDKRAGPLPSRGFGGFSTIGDSSYHRRLDSSNENTGQRNPFTVRYKQVFSEHHPSSHASSGYPDSSPYTRSSPS